MAETSSPAEVAAGSLPAWKVNQLPPPPVGGWRGWMQLLGPGVLLAGASVGSGEWLLGPEVSAQYGATILWLATLSILFQVFCNLEFMRYTLYCGEPVMVGALRSRPGPLAWLMLFLLLDFSSIWPYNASNAAVPLAAAWLGHLPGNDSVSLLGVSVAEGTLVKVLGYLIFLGAFVPLIFGGAIYRMLERLMALKLLVVLGFLGFVAVFLVHASTRAEVLPGFVQFGQLPDRAETVIAGPHFAYTHHVTEAGRPLGLRIMGTIDAKGVVQVTGYQLIENGRIKRVSPAELEKHPSLFDRRDDLLNYAMALVQPGRFFVATDEGHAVSGTISDDLTWQPDRYLVRDEDEFSPVDQPPPQVKQQLDALAAGKGVVAVQAVSYWRQHGRLPLLDWPAVISFAAIAGAGGLTNIMFSNYARDKGWGMGHHVGAIPSAVGGLQIELSHNGEVFLPDAQSLPRWRGWMRHIVKDQAAVWMLASFVGMALPCMVSLEFIRNAPVSGNRVAAMTADGIATRFPDQAGFWWFATLVVAFLVLAPGQVVASDLLARRWTDIVWCYSTRARSLQGNQVKYVYYTVLGLYAVWGVLALTAFDPSQVLKIAGVLQNIALGVTAWMALYVNCIRLPAELRPNWFMRIGTFLAGAFFLAITVLPFLLTR